MEEAVFPDLEDQIVNTEIDPASHIRVGIIDQTGFVVEVIPWSDLVLLGHTEELSTRDYGWEIGDVEYEPTVWETGNLRGR